MTGSENRPDSMSSPISASAWTARPSSPRLNRTPCSVSSGEVGDRDDVCRATRQLDQLGPDAAPGDVERRLDAVGRERANPPDETRRRRRRARPPGSRRYSWFAGLGGADHARTTSHGELDRGAADASGGGVDEQRAAAPRRPAGRARGSAVSMAAGSAAGAGEVERRAGSARSRTARPARPARPLGQRSRTRGRRRRTSVTPSPSSSTTPAASWPRVCGRSDRNALAGHVSRPGTPFGEAVGFGYLWLSDRDSDVGYVVRPD